jgi:hypothetical protein
MTQQNDYTNGPAGPLPNMANPKKSSKAREKGKYTNKKKNRTLKTVPMKPNYKNRNRWMDPIKKEKK